MENGQARHFDFEVHENILDKTGHAGLMVTHKMDIRIINRKNLHEKESQEKFLAEMTKQEEEIASEIRKGNIKKLYNALIRTSKRVAGMKTVVAGISKPYWNAECSRVAEEWWSASNAFKNDPTTEKKQTRDQKRKICRVTRKRNTTKRRSQ